MISIDEIKLIGRSEYSFIVMEADSYKITLAQKYTTTGLWLEGGPGRP